jgi:hypothetical protein
MGGDQSLYPILLLIGVVGILSSAWRTRHEWDTETSLILITAFSSLISTGVVLRLLPLTKGLYWAWIVGTNTALALGPGVGGARNTRAWPEVIDMVVFS